MACIGPPDDRLYNVGPCRVCGIAMLSPDRHIERLAGKNLCGACRAGEVSPWMDPAGVGTITRRRQHHRKHKSIGRQIVEDVAKRHRTVDNKTSLKMSDAAREDLIARIDAELGLKGAA
jgi:hypothetical protein